MGATPSFQNMVVLFNEAIGEHGLNVVIQSARQPSRDYPAKGDKCCLFGSNITYEVKHQSHHQCDDEANDQAQQR